MLNTSPWGQKHEKDCEVEDNGIICIACARGALKTFGLQLSFENAVQNANTEQESTACPRELIHSSLSEMLIALPEQEYLPFLVCYKSMTSVIIQ